MLRTVDGLSSTHFLSRPCVVLRCETEQLAELYCSRYDNSLVVDFVCSVCLWKCVSGDSGRERFLDCLKTS